MNRFKSAAAALAGSGTLLLASLAVAPPAQAEVWDCKAYHNPDGAVGSCQGGWGTYRVSATCVSSKYPYRITIYGNRVTKERNERGASSSVLADPYNCSITGASIQLH